MKRDSAPFGREKERDPSADGPSPSGVAAIGDASDEPTERAWPIDASPVIRGVVSRRLGWSFEDAEDVCAQGDAPF